MRFHDGVPEAPLAELGPDPLCSASIRNRIIIMPDPTLDVPVAATAWGHSYRATCFDRESLDAFVTSNYALAPENLCTQGADLSLVGWCSM